MQIIKAALSAVKNVAKFAFKTPTRAALTAGTIGYAAGSDSYAMRGGAMGHMGMYRGF